MSKKVMARMQDHTRVNCSSHGTRDEAPEGEVADLLYVTQSDVADLEHVWIVVVSWVSVVYRSHLVVAIQVVHDAAPCCLDIASSSPVAAEHLEMSLRSVDSIRYN